MAKSWQEKHDNHPHTAHVERTDKPFAGIPAGATIAIATPREMTAYFKSVPHGRTRSMEQLRAAIAKRHGADFACPLTTGIFCRIAAEHAYEQHRLGARNVAPFWRVIEPDSKLGKKLACGPAFIRAQRAAEDIADAPPRARRPKMAPGSKLTRR